MRGGRLKQLVTFQTATVTYDAFGEPVQTWSDLSECWARIEPLAGRERFSAMQVQAEVDYRITVRYHSALASLAPADRVTWSNWLYDIKAVINPDGRGRDRELHVYAMSHFMPLPPSSVVSTDALLLESGNYLLLEGGDNLLLE